MSSQKHNQAGQAAKLVVQGDAKAEEKKTPKVEYASGNADPTKVIDMEGDDTFERRFHPNDVSVAELLQAKAASCEELFNQRVANGGNATSERRELEKAFARLEISQLSLLEFTRRQTALAQKFETLGIIQAVEAVSALLASSGVNGIDSASQKMATAVRILKEQNGLPEHADSMKQPDPV